MREQTQAKCDKKRRCASGRRPDRTPPPKKNKQLGHPNTIAPTARKTAVTGDSNRTSQKGGGYLGNLGRNIVHDGDGRVNNALGQADRGPGTSHHHINQHEDQCRSHHPLFALRSVTRRVTRVRQGRMEAGDGKPSSLARLYKKRYSAQQTCQHRTSPPRPTPAPPNTNKNGGGPRDLGDAEEDVHQNDDAPGLGPDDHERDRDHDHKAGHQHHLAPVEVRQASHRPV